MARTRESYLAQGELEYIKRLSRNWVLKVNELDNSKFSRLKPEEQRLKEADLVLAKLNSRDFVVILDEGGRQFSSVEFATKIQTIMNQGSSSLVFCVGGTNGWSEGIKKRSDLILSLSALTFTAQIARFVLIEQLYRAYSIINGSGYHRE